MSCAGKHLTPEEAARFRVALQFERLGDKHAAILGDFRCHPRIDNYLKKRALEDAREKRAVTWILVHEDKFLVAYVSLATCTVELGEEERKAHKLPEEGASWPGLLIGQLGTDVRFRERGLAKRLLKFAVGQGISIAESIGCRVLVADINLEEPAINMYRSAGFKPSTHKLYREQAQKKATQKQFLDLFSNPPPDLGPKG
jgi:GNAT superfamily N-acetyltransferase